MYKYFLLLTLTFLPFEGGAQSLIDTCLQRYALGVLAEQIGQLTDVKYAGLVVQESSTGNVIANVSLLLRQGEFVKGPSNSTPFPTPLGRAVLYMCINNPNIVVDGTGGVYKDSEGQVIKDHNAAHGGYGELDLLHGFIYNSDVCSLKASERVFDKDAKKLAVEINRTGILFGARASEKYGRWSSYDILGFSNSSMSLIQSAAWLTAVAGGRLVIRLTASDSGEPYDTIFNQRGRLSLLAAMRLHVTEGLGRSLNSDEVSVAGLTNVSPPTAEGYRSYFAAAIVPYCEKPIYTICIQILSRKGSARPATAVKKICEYLHSRDFINSFKVQEPPPKRLHPAAR